MAGNCYCSGGILPSTQVVSIQVLNGNRKMLDVRR